MEPENQTAEKSEWKALPSHQRRVLGVLVEKAKTTPDGYPLSLNALRNGCNQKSNRSPQLNLTELQVEDAIDGLRRLGAAAEVQGDSRVCKYRHYMKDWLGVDGTELAVMAELLLRGAQSIGDLRGRAARMSPIAGMSELKPVIQALQEKGLLLSLTPEGRGQVVTHNLYLENELEKVRREYPDDGSYSAPSPAPSPASPIPSAPAPAAVPSNDGEVAALREEVAKLREELAAVKKDVQDLWSNLT
jgi:uncharacterized protein YceH (UPF0502 family)